MEAHTGEYMERDSLDSVLTSLNEWGPESSYEKPLPSPSQSEKLQALVHASNNLHRLSAQSGIPSARYDAGYLNQGEADLMRFDRIHDGLGTDMGGTDYEEKQKRLGHPPGYDMSNLHLQPMPSKRKPDANVLMCLLCSQHTHICDARQLIEACYPTGAVPSPGRFE